MSKSWKFQKIAIFWQKKALKWSSYFIFVLYRYENGGVDTRIKFLPWCITKLWAFVNIVARGPIATIQNCKYFEIGMRYRHNFCFYRSPFSTSENTNMTPEWLLNVYFGQKLGFYWFLGWNGVHFTLKLAHKRPNFDQNFQKFDFFLSFIVNYTG